MLGSSASKLAVMETVAEGTITTINQKNRQKTITIIVRETLLNPAAVAAAAAKQLGMVFYALQLR